ncbi:MAG: glycerate kinase, partial [Rubrobacteridae bacterium]|nr:glycerate kinase [Rubrobacteridae bacterium]
NAEMRSGIELVADKTSLRKRIMGASLVITGEGQLDNQSIHGKAPIGVARISKELGIPCVLIAGCFGDGHKKAVDNGVTGFISIEEIAGSTDSAMKNAPKFLEEATERILKSFLDSRNTL